MMISRATGCLERGDSGLLIVLGIFYVSLIC